MAVVEVAAEDLPAALALGGKLIDVREVHEYANGHVAGAVLIPLQTVPDRVEEFRDHNPVYVICRSGARSYRACEFLEQQGVSAVNVAGGVMAWVDNGQPVVEGVPE